MNLNHSCARSRRSNITMVTFTVEINDQTDIDSLHESLTYIMEKSAIISITINYETISQEMTNTENDATSKQTQDPMDSEDSDESL